MIKVNYNLLIYKDTRSPCEEIFFGLNSCSFFVVLYWRADLVNCLSTYPLASKPRL